jgi:hypothetical protein
LLVFLRAHRIFGIAAGYGLDDKKVGVRVTVGSRFFLHVVQTGSRDHLVSYPMGTRALSTELNLPECDADHSTPTNAKVKKTWIYTSIPPYVLMT